MGEDDWYVDNQRTIAIKNPNTDYKYIQEMLAGEYADWESPSDDLFEQIKKETRSYIKDEAKQSVISTDRMEKVLKAAKSRDSKSIDISVRDNNAVVFVFYGEDNQPKGKAVVAPRVTGEKEKGTPITDEDRINNLVIDDI